MALGGGTSVSLPESGLGQPHGEAQSMAVRWLLQVSLPGPPGL